MVYLSIVAEDSIPKAIATAYFQPKQYCGLSEHDGGKTFLILIIIDKTNGNDQC